MKLLAASAAAGLVRRNRTEARSLAAALRLEPERRRDGAGEAVRLSVVIPTVDEERFPAGDGGRVRLKPGQAGRLRRALDRYYRLSGSGDPIRIELPRGTYVHPLFSAELPLQAGVAYFAYAVGTRDGGWGTR